VSSRRLLRTPVHFAESPQLPLLCSVSWSHPLPTHCRREGSILQAVRSLPHSCIFYVVEEALVPVVHDLLRNDDHDVDDIMGWCEVCIVLEVHKCYDISKHIPLYVSYFSEALFF
jgi:hypothetical protein